MSSTNLSTHTLIHASIELLALGGMAFWMRNRTNAIDTTIEELNKKIAILESALDKQQQILLHHEGAIRHLMGEGLGPGQERAQLKPPPRPFKIPSQPQSNPPENLQSSVRSHDAERSFQATNTIPPGPPPVQPQSPTPQNLRREVNKPPEEPEISAEILDKILDAELEKINQPLHKELEIETTVYDQAKDINIKAKGPKISEGKKKILNAGKKGRKE